MATPTVAARPFPVEVPYPQEVAGRPVRHYLEWLSLTYAFTTDGLPVGLRLVGRRRAEAVVLRAAAALVAAAPWTDRLPPLLAPGAPPA